MCQCHLHGDVDVVDWVPLFEEPPKLLVPADPAVSLVVRDEPFDRIRRVTCKRLRKRGGFCGVCIEDDPVAVEEQQVELARRAVEMQDRHELIAS